VRRPQKLLVAIAGTVAATYLLGAALLPFLVNAERLRPQAEAKLQTALGRRVSLGALRLSFWSGPALLATNLRIGEALSGSAAATVLVEAGETAVHVAWLPLLRKQVELRSIAVLDLKMPRPRNRSSPRGASGADALRPGRHRRDRRIAGRDARGVDRSARPQSCVHGALGRRTGSRRSTPQVGPLLRIEAAGRVTDLASPRLGSPFPARRS
jgi:hypothetical protein